MIKCCKSVILMSFLAVLRFQSGYGQSDSLTTFSLADFVSQVLTYHPIAKQASLLSESARQEIRLARGSFDPKFQTNFSNKTFDEKFYFEHLTSMLKVPLWIGELKGGYERNRGSYLNPESDTDKGSGLGVVGISVPLAQGLIIDERRAVLRQAQIFQDMAEAEKVKMINKLVLTAVKDYWTWYFYYHQYRLQSEGYKLAYFRYRAVVQGVLQGDLAALDTIEAYITLQQRDVDLQAAKVAYQNATLFLANYLWDGAGNPLEIPESLIPEARPVFVAEKIQLEELYQFAKTNHPELQKLRFKADQLHIDKRLAREMFKPVINLNYNLLSGMPLETNPMNGGYLSNNYKLGAEIAFPIIFRKERAKWQLNKIKIDQNRWQLIETNRNVMNEITANFNELTNLGQMIALQEAMVKNYRTLVAGEFQKFQNGESTIFYVNVRESKLLEAEIKLFDMQHKYGKTYAGLLYAAGQSLQ